MKNKKRKAKEIEEDNDNHIIENVLLCVVVLTTFSSFTGPDIVKMIIPILTYSVRATLTEKGRNEPLILCTFLLTYSMMTSSNWNIFRVTGHLCGEFTDHGEFPSQRPVTRSFDVIFDLRLWSAPWINSWVNNREAGDLRRHHAHYDVIVMITHAATRNGKRQMDPWYMWGNSFFVFTAAKATSFSLVQPSHQIGIC